MAYKSGADGITNTVPHGHFVGNKVLDKLTEIGNPFLFLTILLQDF